jgi:pyrimidine operon attenuation protein/uracil phosphoribosyltransferase
MADPMNHTIDTALRIAQEVQERAEKAEAVIPGLVTQGQFLCDRLAELEFSDIEGLARDFCGHVEPAISRLRIALDAAEKAGF